MSNSGQARHRSITADASGILVLLAVFASYLLLYRYSNAFHTTDLRATPWNPETGLAVAAGALLGRGAVPAIIAANLAGNLLWGAGLGVGWSLVSSVVHGFMYAGSSAWFSRKLRELNQPTTGLAIRFFVFATALVAISACARLLIAHLALQVSAAYLVRYALAVAIGNLIGILTIVPLALALPTRAAWRNFVGNLTAVDALAFALAPLLSLIVFALKGFDEFKFFYLLFIPVIILAIRQGLPGAAAAILVLDFSMVATLRGLSFEPSTGLELQVLMISLSATGLVLGAAVSERERMGQQLELSHERLHESQAALQHAARLSLASEMTTALAHELNQPLAAARNFVRIVRRQLAGNKLDRAQLASNLDEAVEAVDKAATLLKQSREFLSKGEASKVPLDAAALIDGTIDLIKSELARAEVEIESHKQAGLPKIRGNRVQLQLVLLNLLRNSKEAMIAAPAAVRRIEVGAERGQEPGFVFFSVTDSGPGVSEAVQADLFSPLRSTKPEGLGLGLSLSRSIIANHGGEIWLASDVPRGARFMFKIPVASEGKRTS